MNIKIKDKPKYKYSTILQNTNFNSSPLIIHLFLIYNVFYGKLIVGVLFYRKLIDNVFSKIIYMCVCLCAYHNSSLSM